jgi:hypothetical protein
MRRTEVYERYFLAKEIITGKIYDLSEK